MLMSADLPAPFSPRSAWTSPRRSSKSTWSFARTPGKRFVIPRSSRTTGRSLIARDSTARRTTRAGPAGPLSSYSLETALQLRRRLDPAGDDQGPQLVHLRDERLRNPRIGLADGDAVVLQVEEQVGAALVRPPLGGENRGLDRDVDPLDGARQDVAAEELLVVVDADAPDALLLRRVERTEAAAACDLEHDLGAAVDLRERELLALRLVDEVLREVDQRPRAPDAALRARPVRGDEDVHRRERDAAHGADHVSAVTLRHLGREAPDHVAVLVRRERQSEDVLGEDLPLRVRERGSLYRVVHDREPRVLEPVCDLGRSLGEEEAGRDRNVGVVADEPGEVRDVVAGRPRLERAARAAGLPGAALAPLQRELVEALVVEPADVADHAREERVLRAPRRPGRADDQRTRCRSNEHRADHGCAYLHMPSLE